MKAQRMRVQPVEQIADDIAGQPRSQFEHDRSRFEYAQEVNGDYSLGGIISRHFSAQAR